MINKQKFKQLQSLLLFITLLIVIISYYLQYFQGLEPCPLCMMQRICIFVFAVFCTIAVGVSKLKWAKVIALLQALFALFGLFFALRQVWLQFLPNGQTHACLPGLWVLVHYFSWKDVASVLLWGSGECSHISWRFLGLPISVWSSVYFLCMAIISFLLYRKIVKPIQ